MKVVVLGGVGAMGAQATPELAASGLFDQVVVADIDLPKARQMAADWGLPPSAAVALDAGDAAALAGLMAGAAVVVNALPKGFTLPVERRDEIRSLIGERAEQLAYWNCAMCRLSFDKALERGTPPFVIVDRITGGEFSLSPAELDDLCRLHLCDWLEQLPRQETAVIVNERGDVGIDAELLAARVARLREITGGCVCCDTQAELQSALLELASLTPRPGRILVETSGAASPAGVIRALAAPASRERLTLSSYV